MTMPPPPDPVFKTIAVVGLGLIGGSIAFGAKRTWPSAQVIGIDRPGVLKQAAARRAIDAAAADLDAVVGADLIVLAAPVRQNLKIVHQVAGYASPGAVVTDVGGTKRAIVEAAARRRSFTFVGGHPLGGGARGGFEFATAGLFARRPWILTPEEDTPEDAVSRLDDFVRGLGAVPTRMTAREHDQLMAFLSHVPQLTVSALMDVVGGAVAERGLALAGQGLVDTTRLASSPASVWKDVCITNADAIAEALDHLISRLVELRADLTRGEALEIVFDGAARWRAELMKTRE